jgi:hypothetical protein
MNGLKARLVVTMACNRHCYNCCNQEEVFEERQSLKNLDDLLDYDEIMITGGEPMLIADKVLTLIQYLRDKDYKGKVYLYSAYYDKEWLDEHFPRKFTRILRSIDGFQFTVHNEATDKEITQLKQLCDHYALKEENQRLSLRLSIDARLYERYDFSNIDFSSWGVVRKLKWLDNCPLPKGEQLFIYNL